MQRLFSMFPQGAPGIALMLLRFSVAATFSISLIKRAGLGAFSVLLFSALALSALMVIGFLTPIVSSLIASWAATILMIHFQWDNLCLVFITLNSAAVAILGPGAYSLDGRLFGRRVMVLSSRKHSPRP